MYEGVKTIVELSTGEHLQFDEMVFDIQQGGHLVLFGGKRPYAAFAPGKWLSVVLQGYKEDGEETEGEAQQLSDTDKKYH